MMPLHTHNHRPQENNVREQRLIMDAPAPSIPEYQDAKDRAKESPAGGPSLEDTAKQIAQKCAGFDRLFPQEKQQTITAAIAQFARHPNTFRNANELRTYIQNLSSNLNELGLSKKVTDSEMKALYTPDANTKVFEETQNSTKVSGLLEDTTTVTGRAIRPDGSEQVLCRKMQIEDTATEDQYYENEIVLANHKRVTVNDMVNSLTSNADKAEGFRAVDIDYVEDGMRKHVRRLGGDLRDARSREGVARVRIYRMERALRRRRGSPYLIQMALEEAKENHMIARGEMSEIRERKLYYRNHIQTLKRAKEVRLFHFPVEQAAMRQRAANKARERLLRRSWSLKREGLEIQPGTHHAVTVMPDKSKNMSDAEYAQDYRTRAREAVNDAAAAQLNEALNSGKFEAMAAQIKATLAKAGWDGDSTVEIDPNSNLIKVSGGRVLLRLRPHFYNPDTRDAIRTKGISSMTLDEVPFGGIALGETLAWEVMDPTVMGMGHWRASLQTMDTAQALTRMCNILDNKQISPEELREFVQQKNIEEQHMENGHTSRLPAETITYSSKSLNATMAAELGKFRGNRIQIDEKDFATNPDALAALFNGWNGEKKELVFAQQFNILEKPELAKEMQEFTGTIHFTNMADIEFKANHIGAVRYLSYLYRENENAQPANIFGLHQSIYAAMRAEIAKRGESEPDASATLPPQASSDLLE